MVIGKIMDSSGFCVSRLGSWNGYILVASKHDTESSAVTYRAYKDGNISAEITLEQDYILPNA